MLSVAELAKGQSGLVVAVHGSDAISLRLLEMGLTPGTKLTVIGAAPLGDPLEIEVRNYRLGVRLREAKRVEVEQTG